MPKTSLIVLILLSLQPLAAQHNVSKDVVVTVQKAQREKEINLVYSATNNTVGRQTIVLNIEGRSFERADGSIPVVRELLPGPNRLIQLTNASNMPVYGYLWVAGCVDTKPEKIIYLLPVAEGKATRVSPLQGMDEFIAEQTDNTEKPTEHVAYAFSANPGDQIYAARRGTVIEIVEKNPVPTGKNLSYYEDHNFLLLEHDDCTRGKYSLFAEDGIEVGLGQLVEAGEPLGKVMDGTSLSLGTHLRFTVYYTGISRKGLIEKFEDRAKTYSQKYISCTFHGVLNNEGGNEVTAEHPEKLILQEMNKRDIKKWKKRGGQ